MSKIYKWIGRERNIIPIIRPIVEKKELKKRFYEKHYKVLSVIVKWMNYWYWTDINVINHLYQFYFNSCIKKSTLYSILSDLYKNWNIRKERVKWKVLYIPKWILEKEVPIEFKWQKTTFVVSESKDKPAKGILSWLCDLLWIKR